MYEKTIVIPDAGESEQYPFSGSAVQLVHGRWRGMHDPYDNPRFQADSGELDVRMKPGDPVPYSFENLTIANPGNLYAKGERVLIRIYEEGDEVVTTHESSTIVRHGRPSFNYRTIDETVEIGPAKSGFFSTVPPPPKQAGGIGRLQGVTLGLYKTTNVASGFRVELQVIDYQESVIGGGTYDVTSSDRLHTVVSDILLPKYQVYFKLITQDGGEGWCEANIRGTMYNDDVNGIPPR